MDSVSDLVYVYEGQMVPVRCWFHLQRSERPCKCLNGSNWSCKGLMVDEWVVKVFAMILGILYGSDESC